MGSIGFGAICYQDTIVCKDWGAKAVEFGL